MKSKAPLMLMEQMVMLLVFALAAALCLQAFVKADEISRRSEARDRAVILCQTVAEEIKAVGEVDRNPVSALASKMDADYREPGTFGLEYNKDWQRRTGNEEIAYQVTVTELDSGVPGLGTADIMVTNAGRSPEPLLFEVQVCWQEVSAHG